MKTDILSLINGNPETIHRTGFCGFKGATCMQHIDAFSALYDLINEMNIRSIIEIGSAAGGLTTFLSETVKDLNTPCTIDSYELKDRPYFDQLRSENVNIHIGSVWEEECINSIGDLIQQPRPVLVLCDGGNKIKEFNTFSKYLKPGDIIMCHDYSKDREMFENQIKDNIWNWCEVTYEDIESSVHENHLTPYNEQLFQQCVWSCFTKTAQ